MSRGLAKAALAIAPLLLLIAAPGEPARARVAKPGRTGTTTPSGKETVYKGPRGRITAKIPVLRLPVKIGARIGARLKARAQKLRSCYHQVLRRNPKLQGEALIRFWIDHKGRTSRVTVAVKGLPASLGACVKFRIKRWYLRRIPRSTHVGPWRIRFSLPPRGSTGRGSGPGGSSRSPVGKRRYRPTCDHRPRRPRSRPRSRISARVPPVKGAGSRAATVRSRLRRRTYMLRYCHERELHKNPKVQGQARVRLIILKTGRIARVRVAARGLPLSMRVCIRSKMAMARVGPVLRNIHYGPIRVKFQIRR